MKNRFSLTTMIATCCGLGLFPIAPGTIGSMIAFPLYFILAFLFISAKGGVASLASPDLTNSLLVFFTGLFFVGAWAAEQYSLQAGKKDPKEIIIDEVVGQSLTICIIIFFLPYIGMDYLKKFIDIGISEPNFVYLNLLSAFILFRLFDIIKPWPINYIDKTYKSGLGVMLDDAVAAVFASIMHYFILYAIIDRL